MSLLFNKEDILLVNRRLAAIVGLNEAIVLQQIHYWVKKKGGGIEYQGVRWVFNSLERWQEQFPFWSQDTVKRALAALKAKGLVRVEKLSDVGRDRTNYYTIDYKQVALLEEGILPRCSSANCTNASGQVAPMDQGNLHSSIGANCTDANKTKTTQETTTKTTLPAAALPAAKVKAEPVDEKETALQLACKKTWAAYSTAYERRYGAKPVRNQSVNSKVKQFVQRIGFTESPSVAAFYVDRVSDSLVVRRVHDVGLLLSGAEGYRTQWAAGAAMTGTRAQQIDQSQSNYDAAGEAMAILRQRRAEAASC